MRINLLKTTFLAFVFGVMIPGQALPQQQVIIGTKSFTESVILGEISKQLLENSGFEVPFFKQLGGTRILWDALITGKIDAYPDYTGTIMQEILGADTFTSIGDLNRRLEPYGVQATRSLGYNNTYALGMLQKTADELGINTIDDLRQHGSLKYGFSNEFLDRADGWPGLQKTYNLQSASVTGLDHDLAYRGLQSGSIDVIDLYSTDAEIDYYNLKVLSDDRHYFPDYEAVFLYRTELEQEHPEAVNILRQLEEQISEAMMIQMNAAVKIDRKNDAETASAFLKQTFGIETEVVVTAFWKRLRINTAGHLYLVGISLGLAILFAIPLGIIAAKIQFAEQFILGVTGILQTIPSLALLVFMIPLLGIGAVPAMAALFLYSLLPIVRNTHAGLKNIPAPLLESAAALGLPESVILRKVELPLALPSILAGIKTSAVINVGTATLGALIGAGGYGQPILTGIRLDSVPLILEGAVPAAVLALLVQGFFDVLEKRLTVNH